MRKLCLFALVSSIVGNGTLLVAAPNCPTLTPSNIGEAACSTTQKPFLTAALASVKFHAVTACPSGIWKKKLQGMFKGEKDYSPTPGPITEGTGTCTYTLDGKWKAKLGAKTNTLVVEVNLPTREHANYWSGPSIGSKCPQKKPDEIDEIKSGQWTETTKTDLSLTMSVNKHQFNDDFVSKAKSMAAETPTSNVPAGKLAVAKGFEVTCNYTIHLGGDATGQTITIKGVQAKK